MSSAGAPDAAAAVEQAGSHGYGLVLAFVASASNNIGKALQKRGTQDLPRMSLERKVLLSYARHPTWRLGFAADVGGAVLMLLALQAAPLSLVQPIAGSGMAVLALFSHFYLREELRLVEWIGVLTASAGAVGVGSIAAPAPQSAEEGALVMSLSAALVLLCLLGGLAGLELLARRMQLRDKSAPICELSSHARALHELAAGIQGGLLFGLSAAASRAALLLSEQLGAPALVPLGVCCSVLLTAAGFFLQARGLKDGRAVVVCTYAAISTIASGVIIGVVALHEPLPQTSLELAAWWVSLGAIVTGVSLLVRRGIASAGAASQRPE